jgi:hypothetical protein
MGWDGCHREKGISSFAFFKKELGDSLLKLRVKGSVAYGAYKDKKDNIFAVVILMKWTKDPYFNFQYKVMDEGMGPYNYDCPADILDMLTAPLNQYSEAWRREQKAYRAVCKLLDLTSPLEALKESA